MSKGQNGQIDIMSKVKKANRDKMSNGKKVSKVKNVECDTMLKDNTSNGTKR
jgi:hypothetical protein